MKTDDNNDPETDAIVSKLKGGQADKESGDEGEGDAGEEAKNVAAEDLFQALRGRAPSEQERADTVAALDAYHKACGY